MQSELEKHGMLDRKSAYIYIYMHIYMNIYIYIYVCICVFMYVCIRGQYEAVTFGVRTCSGQTHCSCFGVIRTIVLTTYAVRSFLWANSLSGSFLHVILGHKPRAAHKRRTCSMIGVVRRVLTAPRPLWKLLLIVIDYTPKTLF